MVNAIEKDGAGTGGKWRRGVQHITATSHLREEVKKVRGKEAYACLGEENRQREQPVLRSRGRRSPGRCEDGARHVEVGHE